jgi:hypothetical protein
MIEDKNRYGVDDLGEFIAAVKESATYRMCGPLMVIAGLLSDAQEMLQDQNEPVRKQLNLAKVLMFELMEKRL